MRTVILLALGFVAACGGNGDDHEQQAEVPDTARPQAQMRAADEGDASVSDASHSTVLGVVNVVGSDPNPQIVLAVDEGEETEQVALVGALQAELGRLAGVEVSVVGNESANPYGGTGRAIDVIEYDVESVNGAPAYLGVLETREGELWLDRDRALMLTSVPTQLENLAGAKVWIAGPVDGDELRVQSFGVVKER